MRITCISTDEAIEGSNKFLLACIIIEVVPFQVVNEDMAGNILNALNLATFVQTLPHIKDLSRSVSNYLSGMRSMSIVVSLVVIALDPKLEISLSLNHFVINLLISVKRLHIVNVVLYITCTADQAEVNNINTSQHSKCHSYSQKGLKTDDCCDQPPNQ